MEYSESSLSSLGPAAVNVLPHEILELSVLKICSIASWKVGDDIILAFP